MKTEPQSISTSIKENEMVRIVEYRPAPEVLQQVICKHCGALLEYTQKEVKKYSGKDISGGPDGTHWIDCPQCDERVVLKSW